MARKARQVETMELDELEELHERCNQRRGELMTELRRLEADEERGKSRRLELHRVRRSLQDLEDESAEYLPALQDARARDAAEVRRVGEIARLERQIAVLEDLVAFQRDLEEAVREHLAPHLGQGRRGFGADVPASRYARLARDVLGGPLHSNGNASSPPAQVALALQRAQRRLADLRGQEEVPS